MGAIDAHVVGQRAQPAERGPELLRRALEHLAAAQGEQRVAAEQRPLLAEGVGDVAAGVAGHEEDLGLGLAEAVAVAVVDLDVDARDARLVAPRADDGAAGGFLDLEVAADMVAMVVGVEDMRDLPAALAGLGQDGPGHGRVDDADGAALRLAHQPDVIVAQDRDSDDFEGCAHDATLARLPPPRHGRWGSVSARSPMWTDVLDLNEFYASTLGQMTVRLLRARLREVWPNVSGETVLGLGYATPFLRPFIDEAAAHHGLHAGPAGRHALAARGPQPHRPGRRDGPAAARPLGRPRAAGPCHRMHRAGAADAARDLAGDGRRRPADRRGADARRPVVADRPLALLSGPSLLRPASSPPCCAPTCSRRCARPARFSCRRPARG